MASERLERSLTEAIGRTIRETINNSAEQSQTADTQQQARPQHTAQPHSVSNQATRQTTLSGMTASRQLTSHRAIALPSLFGGNGIVSGPKKRKRSATCKPKTGKTYTKDVVCLLPSENVRDFPIPRGAKRTKLADMGLIGKVSIHTTWTADEVAREITSVFATSFNLQLGEILPFTYLCITKGTKRLTIPKTSTSFVWNAPEVVSNSAQGCLYIMSDIKPTCASDSDMDDDSIDLVEGEPEVATVSTEQINVTQEPDGDDDDDIIMNTHPLSDERISICNPSPSTSTGGNSCYRSYLNLLASDPIEVSDDEESNELQTAIENSLLTEQIETNPDVTVESVLREDVSIKMVGQPSDVDICKNINVRRNHVFDDGINKMARSKFEPSRPLSVKFADEMGASEGAVDLGGPTREFLRLAIREAFSTNAFRGSTTSKVIVINQEAKRRNLYFHCGKLLAIALCNGGGVGHSLAPCMFDFFAHGDSGCHPSLDDIPEPEIQKILQQISCSVDETAFNTVVRSDAAIDIFGQAGYHGVAKFDKKEELVSDLCHFFVIDKARSALEMFRDGLRTLDVLDLLKDYPSFFRPYFCYTPIDITAEYVDRIFKPIFSEEGCKIREREELIVMHWRDYLQDREEYETSPDDSRFTVTLPAILVFATGADEVPPLGFRPKATIRFWDDVRPRSNTCSNVLFLPLHRDKDDVAFDAFKELMDDAILNSPTFGLA